MPLKQTLHTLPGKHKKENEQTDKRSNNNFVDNKVVQFTADVFHDKASACKIPVLFLNILRIIQNYHAFVNQKQYFCNISHS